MSILSTVYILAAFCVAASVQTTAFNKCSNTPAPLQLRVEGCTSMPCPLVRGTLLHAQWDFAVTSPTKTLTPKVRVTVLGVTTSYDYPYPDACKDLVNANCPLEKGEIVTYSLAMPIERFYPSVSLSIEFSLINERNEPEVCFSLDGKVVN